MTDDLLLRPAWHDDLPVLAEIYLDARRAAIPAMPAVVHSAHEVRAWVAAWNLAAQEVYVAESAGEAIGFANVEAAWLNGLYVAPVAQGGGVGTALLDLVKGIRPDGFGLWVFETNLPARRFYRRHGLIETEHADGSANEEGAPDIRMEWRGDRS